MADERPRVITRRELLQSAGAVSAAAAAGAAGVEAAVEAVGSAAQVTPSTQERAAASSGRESYEHLTADEARIPLAIYIWTPWGLVSGIIDRASLKTLRE